MPNVRADMRQNWWHSHRMSFWPATPLPWGLLQQATHTVPIVFAGVVDPVGAGFVDSLARPGGHTTGFTQFEYGMSGKWLELLKAIAPRMTRAAVLRDVTIAGTGEFAAIQTGAPSLGVEVSPLGSRDAGEIERGIADFARSPNGGLIVATGALAVAYRQLITALAARHRLPAIYPYRFFSPSAAWFPMGPIGSSPFGEQRLMSIASLRAKSQAIFLCRRLPSMN